MIYRLTRRRDTRKWHSWKAISRNPRSSAIEIPGISVVGFFNSGREREDTPRQPTTSINYRRRRVSRSDKSQNGREKYVRGGTPYNTSRFLRARPQFEVGVCLLQHFRCRRKVRVRLTRWKMTTRLREWRDSCGISRRRWRRRQRACESSLSI